MRGFPGSSDGKTICLQCGRPRFDPWVGKIPGEGNGDPLQYSCLDNPMDGGAWWAIQFMGSFVDVGNLISGSSAFSKPSLYIWKFSVHILLKPQFSSVAQSCPTLCDPMNRSMPGLPVHHHLPEFTQTHIHQVHDAIPPSPQSSPSPPAPNPSQHQSLFQ